MPAMPDIARTIIGFLLAAAACTQAQAAGGGLQYFGGPVVSNAQVFMINWNSDVSAQVQQGMPTFYADILQSDYWSVLSQYATPAPQALGNGTYTGATTLLSTQCGAGSGACTLDYTSVTSEIGTRINSDDPALPALAADAAGRLNTVFVVHFPSNVTIMIQSSRSCVDFGATYDNFQADAAHGNRIVPIAIVPDCGVVAPETVLSSGILGDIAVNPQYFFTAGWADSNGAGAGFRCSGASPATVLAGGHAYSVSPLWSNSSNACVSGNRIFAGDFEAH